MAPLRSQLLRPLISRGIATADLPLYHTDGPSDFHVVATAPSGTKLYLLNVAGEFTVGFGEHWHCHIHVGDPEPEVTIVEELVSGSSVVVEWFTVHGKYTGSGPVPAADIPGRRRGDRCVVLSWQSEVAKGDSAAE